MKKRLLLINAGFLLLSLNFLMAQNQNPYDRIRLLAQSSPAITHKAENDVRITTNNPLYRVMSRQPIQFKPFELINRAGKPMNPDSLVRLPNGTSITLKNYLDHLNELERQLNLAGYTLRRDSNILISKMYTDTVFKKSKYTVPEKVETISISTNPLPNKVEAAGAKARPKKVETISNSSDPIPNKVEAAGAKAEVTNLRLKKIYEESPYREGLGDPSIVSADLYLNFIRSAEIYSQNKADIKRNKSQMSLKAIAEINGALFGKTFNLFSANAYADAPADTYKDKTVDVSVKVIGLTIWNVNKSFSASQPTFNETGKVAKSMDESVGITIPIFGPVTFVGKLGVRGSVGIEYGITGTYAPDITFNVNPTGDLSVYGEVGIGLSDIVQVGVGGNLTLIRANMNFGGTVGIANLYVPLANSFPLYLKYKLDLDLSMLNGNFYLFGRLCTPGFWGLPQLCTSTTHEIFNWEGYKITTTLAEGDYIWELKK